MTTDNRANEPTAEQILVDEWIRQADRAKSMTGMDAIWFPDVEETLAVLRANGLLSEGTPSEEQARAIRKLDNVQAILAGAQASITDAVRELSPTSAALVAAVVAPQEPCPQPCEHLSAEDAREGRDCREHPCTCPTSPTSDREKLIEEARAVVPQAETSQCGPCRRGQHGCCDGNGYLRCECSHGAAPVLPSSDIDEDALAEVIEAEIDKLRHETRLYPDIYKTEVARAVAAWLKGQGGESRDAVDKD